MYPNFSFLGLETAPRSNFSHSKQMHDSNHTRQLMNIHLRLLGSVNLAQLINMTWTLEMKALQGKTACFYARKDRNAPSSTNQGLPTAGHTHGYAPIGTSTHFPCPTLSALAEPISKGHCRKWHHETKSPTTSHEGRKGL